jgi:hypothetical protein
MSILFLQIVNLEDKQVIGTYESNELNNSSVKIEIETKSKELIPKSKLKILQ